MVDEPVTLELLGARTLAMSAELRDMQQRVGTLEVRFTAMEQRFTALAVTVDSRFAVMETRLDAIEQRMAAQEERINRLIDLVVRMACTDGRRAAGKMTTGALKPACHVPGCGAESFNSPVMEQIA